MDTQNLILKINIVNYLSMINDFLYFKSHVEPSQNNDPMKSQDIRYLSRIKTFNEVYKSVNDLMTQYEDEMFELLIENDERFKSVFESLKEIQKMGN